MPFEFIAQSIPEVILVKPRLFTDDRGFFAEIYKQTEFLPRGIGKPFLQANHSRSKRGTIRGLHYQKNPKAQGKLVRVLSGEIFDVAVDLRRGSPTCGTWVGVRLDAADMHMLYVPEGFAHGFSVLSESADVEYFCTEVYSPEHERGIVFNDAALNVPWGVERPLVSPKDAVLPPLEKADNDFSYP